MKRVIGFSLAGFVYGAVLFLFATACAGPDARGTYLPFGIYGAPFSMIRPPLGLFVPPFLWALLGFFLGKGERGWATALLGLHLVGVAVVLLSGMTEGSLWMRGRAMQTTLKFAPEFFWGGLGLYAVGQAVAWFAALGLLSTGRKRLEKE